jgi:hypothetical protein
MTNKIKMNLEENTEIERFEDEYNNMSIWQKVKHHWGIDFYRGEGNADTTT